MPREPREDHELADELAELRDFLNGETRIKGEHVDGWFGERHKNGRFLSATFWWRPEMRRRLDRAIEALRRPSPVAESGFDHSERMARRMGATFVPRNPASPVAESTPTDATAVEAEREACAEVVRAAIELGLQAGRLSNALDGQEDYRLQRQAVLNAMKDLSTALDARTPKES